MHTIAVLSDIHGNLPALEAVVADLQPRGVDAVVNLGDHASGPLWPAETITFLMGQPWQGIAGNHDRQVVHQAPATHGASDRYAFERLSPDHLAWLRALPPTHRVSPDLFLCHGTPTSDSDFLLETIAHGALRLAPRAAVAAAVAGVEAQVILCGHSHIPRLVAFADGMLVVNPGSVGLPAAEDHTPEPYAIEVGAPHARYALLARHPHGWQATFIAVPYDHASAARQAARNGRPDWEVALRTGYVRA